MDKEGGSTEDVEATCVAFEGGRELREWGCRWWKRKRLGYTLNIRGWKGKQRAWGIVGEARSQGNPAPGLLSALVPNLRIHWPSAGGQITPNQRPEGHQRAAHPEQLSPRQRRGGQRCHQ